MDLELIYSISMSVRKAFTFTHCQWMAMGWSAALSHSHWSVHVLCSHEPTKPTHSHKALYVLSCWDHIEFWALLGPRPTACPQTVSPLPKKKKKTFLCRWRSTDPILCRPCNDATPRKFIVMTTIQFIKPINYGGNFGFVVTLTDSNSAYRFMGAIFRRNARQKRTLELVAWRQRHL